MCHSYSPWIYEWSKLFKVYLIFFKIRIWLLQIRYLTLSLTIIFFHFIIVYIINIVDDVIFIKEILKILKDSDVGILIQFYLMYN